MFSMTVKKEVTAYSLWDDLWSGGRDTLDDLNVDEAELILSMLDDLAQDGVYTLTEINDFFWFERDTIAEWLGYENYDELMNRDVPGEYAVDGERH